MKRCAVLLILFLLLGGMAAAGDYETVLFTDDLNIDFRMKGWEFSRLEGTEIVIDFKYNLTLENDAYNSSDITGFDLLLKNETHTITRKQLETMTVKRGEWTSRQGRFRVTAQPDEVNQMAFRANHTATLWDGGLVERMVESRQAFELDVTNQTILSFATNASRAYRDEPIFIEADTDNVFELTANGHQLTRGDAGRFYAWLPVSTDLETGNRSVQYVLETARGQRFIEELRYEVLNRAPRFTADYRKSIPEGEDAEVTVFAVDDTGVRNVSLWFQEAVRWNSSTASPRFTLSTADLAPGTYTFDVEATDLEGVATTENYLFRVTPPQPDSAGEGNGEDTDYSELSILEGIITFFQGFIDFLIPR